MHCSSGILFNHESPRRGPTFVTQKIVRGLHGISRGTQEVLELGNLKAKRDWGHAKDFVQAMWLMLQQTEADDYVVATGEQHSVKQFVEVAAPYFGMHISWAGEGADEVGINQNGKVRIRVNERYLRPTEVESLLGDATKARQRLGWRPMHTFETLVEDMCRNGHQ